MFELCAKPFGKIREIDDISVINGTGNNLDKASCFTEDKAHLLTPAASSSYIYSR